MSLWGGRFTDSSHRRFEKFNRSIQFDFRLVRYDILVSRVWSRALCAIGVVDAQEQGEIERALDGILDRVGVVGFEDSGAEDVHTWTEQQLIRRLGELGKKTHTGCSRNDRVATDMKLWCKDCILTLWKSIHKVQSCLVVNAEKHKNVLIPGFTHLQRAQTITFAHWGLAYFEMLERDKQRLFFAYNQLRHSPMGSGALAGTTYPVDLRRIAELLGFSSIGKNSIDNVSDRDHAIELISHAAIGMMHLSRFAEDVIFFNSNEAQFIELPDGIASGSSLMPQKKNPDALELMRGKFGRVQGSLVGMLSVMKGLPLSYNKDMQEDKENVFGAVDTWMDSLDMAALVLRRIQPNLRRCRKAAEASYNNASALLDHLVLHGVSFRRAHQIVGRIVLQAVKQHRYLQQFSSAELQTFHPAITEDVCSHLTIERCVSQHDVPGGVNLVRIDESVVDAKRRLDRFAESIRQHPYVIAPQQSPRPKH